MLFTDFITVLAYSCLTKNLYGMESPDAQIVVRDVDKWIGLCSVLRPRQHSIGYMGNGFYRSKDPTNSNS